MKKVFEVKVKYSVEGKFFVEADNVQDAARIVNDNCYFVVDNSNIKDNDCDDIIDWEFPLRAELNKMKVIKGE